MCDEDTSSLPGRSVVAAARRGGAMMPMRRLERQRSGVWAGVLGAGFVFWVGACALWPAAPREDRHAKKDEVEVRLCDGETTTRVPKDMERTPAKGQEIADALMAQWRRKHPDRDWVEEERSKHKIVEPASNDHLVGNPQASVYAKITRQDVVVWERESLRFATEGSRVFHSGDELGSTIAVSCDMCHPDAANTHPETYPKFQEQLGRVALLRDMINWCIEHPVRGAPLAPDDPKMRALEAYILAQRKGAKLDYGRH
jgi:cytochrome c553